MGNEEIDGMTLCVSYSDGGEYKVFIPAEAVKNVTPCLLDDDYTKFDRIYKREVGEW